MHEYLHPGEANYKVWWKRRNRSDADPFDGTKIVVGHMEASRFLGIKKTELGDKYNVGMFRVSDDLAGGPGVKSASASDSTPPLGSPASTASQEV